MVSLFRSHCHSVSLTFITRLWVRTRSITLRRTSSSERRASLCWRMSSGVARRRTALSGSSGEGAAVSPGAGPTAAGAGGAALLGRDVADGGDLGEVLAPLDLDDDRLLDAKRRRVVRPGEVPLAGALETDLDCLWHQASLNTPIAAYFSARRLTSFSGRIFRSSVTWRISASRSRSPAASGSTWAPPTGSGTTSSMSLSRSRSSAVSLRAAAARSRWLESFQRIAAHPSGEMTE